MKMENFYFFDFNFTSKKSPESNPNRLREPSHEQESSFQATPSFSEVILVLSGFFPRDKRPKQSE
jgi:hypothetical protein